MTHSYWHLEKIENPAPKHTSYDVLIAGGGIAGLSSAYWLQRQNPRLRIGILEAQHLGAGASGRNAGFVTCGSTEHFIKLKEQFGLDKAVEIWKFSEQNRELLLEHIIEDDTDLVDFRQTGSCTVAPSSQHWEKYQAVARDMKAAGISVHEVGASEMERDYGVTGFEGGIQYTGDGYIHPMKLLRRMRQRTGADVLEGVRVLGIESRPEACRVHTSQGTLEAGQVLVTLNAYLPLVAASYQSLIKPGRGQILLTEPLPAFIKGPCYLTKHLCYFRQLPTGHLLIGGFRNLAVEAENTHEDQTTELIQSALWDFVRSHFSKGRDAKVAYQWAGIMGFSPDGQMMIGANPDHPRVHVMAGCSGHGMGLSFHAAKVLCESLMGIAIPEHLQLSRFEKQKAPL